MKYYDAIGAVSREGDWEGWLRLFLTAVEVQTNDAIRRTERLLALQSPYLTAPWLAEELKITNQTAHNLCRHLVDQDILRRVEGRRSPIVYCAWEVLRTLEEPESD